MDASPVTQLLHDLRSGQRDAFDALLPHVLDALRAIAHRQLKNERSDHTLNTTALVHEAYLKLVGRREMDWESRAHFFAVAARAMRRVLISYARQRNAEKRGGGAIRVTLVTHLGPLTEGQEDELVALDEGLQRLEQINPRHARIVECRFFAGLTIEETAECLGVSPITVTRDWRMARAWLRHELSSSDD